MFHVSFLFLFPRYHFIKNNINNYVTSYAFYCNIIIYLVFILCRLFSIFKNLLKKFNKIIQHDIRLLLVYAEIFLCYNLFVYFIINIYIFKFFTTFN